MVVVILTGLASSELLEEFEWNILQSSLSLELIPVPASKFVVNGAGSDLSTGTGIFWSWFDGGLVTGNSEILDVNDFISRLSVAISEMLGVSAVLVEWRNFTFESS